jgi:hypothetical protein
MKNLSLVLAATLLLSACSKTIKKSSQGEGATSTAKEVLPLSDQSSLDEETLRTLLHSEAANLALTQLLVKTVSPGEKELFKSLMAELSDVEAKLIIAKVQQQNSGIRKNYLFHGQKYQNNQDFMTNVLSTEIAVGDMSLASQLRVSAFTYIKNKSLDEIISAYNERAYQLTKDLSEEIAFDLGLNSPGVAKELEEALRKLPPEKVIEMIKTAKPFVEKIDKYFKSSDLTEKEQYTLLVSAAIAGGVFELLQQNSGFAKIVSNGQRIVRDIQVFQKKAKEATVLLASLGKHLDDTAQNVKDFTSGMVGARSDLSKLMKEAESNRDKPEAIDSKKIYSFLYNKVIRGKDIKDDGTNSSILSKQYSINANVMKSVSAVGNMADNLSNILATTNNLSKILGIKPSKDLLNIMDKAQKVSQAVSIVKSALTGYIAGGPLGAMTALSSSPLMSMMGGGGGDSAKLNEISKKLDKVLENQRKMMQMQIETMNMIKDLALMIDRYHQDEMVALAELRDVSLVTMEISKAQLNKDLRNCERLISFQLQSVWSQFDFGAEAVSSINHLELIQNKFYSSIKSLPDLRRSVISLDERTFENCQAGLIEAFGSDKVEENPLRAMFSQTEENNLTKFEREKYLPLLESLKFFSGTRSFDSMPLHFPTTNIKALKLKTPYIDYAKNDEDSGHQIYAIESLISSKALERYLTNYLVLYPLMEVDKKIWAGSLQDIVREYLNNAHIGADQHTRSLYLLSNALKFTQSAIAQEAILAGEPILHKLFEMKKDIFSSKKCEEAATRNVPRTIEIPYVCSLRSNYLLMKNLVMYSLHVQNEKNSDFFALYEQAYLKGDLSELSRLFEGTYKQGEKKEILLTLQGERGQSLSIKMPTPEDLRAGKILYSENMPRLLLMQDLILENLEKVAPVDRNYKEDLLKVILIGNAS